MTSADLSDTLVSRLGDTVTGRSEFRGELTLTLRPGSIASACRFCRDELAFDLLLDISSVDLFEHDPRYELVYELPSSPPIHLRSRQPRMPKTRSWTPSATSARRQLARTRDLGHDGIRFAGHPTSAGSSWEGYPYHPAQGLPSRANSAMSLMSPSPRPAARRRPVRHRAGCRHHEVREPRARRAGDLPPRKTFTAEP